MAHSCQNHIFHNSTSCSNIQGTDSSFGKKQKEGFGACVVAVAVLDGCVCQGGWPCSLMMAMPAHKPSPGDMCVCVCVIFQDE